jgi:hypothetical protein
MIKLLMSIAAALAAGAILVPGVTAKTSRTDIGCGPKVSVLLWPKGYKAYPLPNVEVFTGWSGPFGVANLLGYGTATRDGTLGYPSQQVGPYCVNVADKLTAGPLKGHASAAVRLSCVFPKALVIQIDKLASNAKRFRVALSTGTVVADATVTAHGSKLAYSTAHCKVRRPLIEPTS